ncbi:MAG: hypothetical protein ABI970_19545, partial [Chloroflexota bacterium]
TAAAIILFALGAYLFTGNKNAPTATGSVSQAPQSAFAITATGTTLDKAAATEPEVFNEIEPSSTLENSPSNSAGGGLSVPDDTLQLTATVMLSEETDQSQAQANIAQSTSAGTLSDGVAAGSAADSQAQEAQTQIQGRTSEATETITNQQYAAPSSSNSAENAPSAPLIEPSVVTEAYSVAPAFAATEPLSTPTSAASSTPTLTDTLIPSATHTTTPAPTATPLPTVTPQSVPAAPPAASDSLPTLLIVLAAILLIVGIGTTIIRRRNRP